MKKQLLSLVGLTSLALAGAYPVYQNSKHQQIPETPATVQETPRGQIYQPVPKSRTVKKPNYDLDLPIEKISQNQTRITEQVYEPNSLEEKIASLTNTVEILYGEFRGMEPDYTETRPNKKSGTMLFGDKKVEYESDSMSLAIHLPTQNSPDATFMINFITYEKNPYVQGFFIGSEKQKDLVRITYLQKEDGFGNYRWEPEYSAFETNHLFFCNVKNDKMIKLSESQQITFNSFASLLLQNMKLSHPETFNRDSY